MLDTKSEILLETGTNELEVLEFTIAGNGFGINVAKIREIMQYQKPQPMARAHAFIEGIFKPRSETFTVLDLAAYLGLPASEDDERDILIIAGFNKMNVAFHVHAVESINRISWGAIEKPDDLIYGGSEGIATGIAKIQDRMVSIIDFEKIVYDISPESGIQFSELRGERGRYDTPVLIAEDSQLLRKMIEEALHIEGYQNVLIASDGQEAWEMLEQIRDNGVPIENQVVALITDIEMPQMDGHHLTKKVKDDPKLGQLPVIIFSSLIDDAMRVKGNEVGADAQLSKPEIGNLVSVLDQLIHRVN